MKVGKWKELLARLPDDWEIDFYPCERGGPDEPHIFDGYGYVGYIDHDKEEAFETRTTKMLPTDIVLRPDPSGSNTDSAQALTTS